MSQNRVAVLCLAPILAAGALASAQEAPAKDKKSEAAKAAAPSDSPRVSEEVDVAVESPGTATDTTVLKLPVPLQTTPASVSLVPATLMIEQNAVVLGDALKNAPGVNVATGFGVFRGA
jgi:catecholate siderophore receptor